MPTLFFLLNSRTHLRVIVLPGESQVIDDVDLIAIHIVIDVIPFAEGEQFRAPDFLTAYSADVDH